MARPLPSTNPPPPSSDSGGLEQRGLSSFKTSEMVVVTAFIATVGVAAALLAMGGIFVILLMVIQLLEALV